MTVQPVAQVSLPALMADAGKRIEATLDALIPRGDGPEARLFDAMRYATLGGGKRLRPFLVMSGAALFGVAESHALRAGAAVEFIHCYSLVHDDLPAMDDDDLRRGRPTCHIKFDEATAILAGDGLLTLAFEVLADPATHPDAGVRAELIADLARSSGGVGMVGGQMFDLRAEQEGHKFGLDDITRLQRMKTGAIIGYACRAGAILGRAKPAQRQALDLYARDLGLAFQIADDLLDAEGTVEQVGKQVGKDADAGKATFISILGVEKARKMADNLVHQASQHLETFGSEADILRSVARFVVDRKA
ncbi:MAG: polyprenyl synthetase family protein [Alphaproteobacteria bacterium]